MILSTESDLAYLMRRGIFYPYPLKSKDSSIVSILESICGACDRIRTYDLLITNQLLYQLSYTGMNDNKDKAHSRGF